MKEKNLDDYPELLNIKDLCNYLNISRTTAYSFINNSEVKYRRVGRVYMISKKSLADNLGVEMKNAGDKV